MERAKHINTLTPLRGIAAILVAIFHYHLIAGPLLPAGNRMFSKLYLMVDLFFVLSGFILMHVYEPWFAKGFQLSKYGNFLKARIARIYPLHIITFLIVLLFGMLLRSKLDLNTIPPIFLGIADPTAIPFVLTMTHAWGSHIEATWNTVSWSISVEWFLYLIFPLIIFVQVKVGKAGTWVWALLGMILLFLVAFYFEQPHLEALYTNRGLPPEVLAGHSKYSLDVITGSALLRGLGGFLIGISAYKLYENRIGERLLCNGIWFIIIWVVLFGLWYKDYLLDPFAVLIFGILILHGSYARGIVSRILNGKVFSFLGDISYSIYLCHMMLFLSYVWICMINGWRPWPLEDGLLNNWIEVLVFLLTTILISTLTYYGIERPARRWIKGLGAKV